MTVADDIDPDDLAFGVAEAGDEVEVVKDGDVLPRPDALRADGRRRAVCPGEDARHRGASHRTARSGERAAASMVLHLLGPPARRTRALE
jgi:hypothetical protein